MNRLGLMVVVIFAAGAYAILYLGAFLFSPSGLAQFQEAYPVFWSELGVNHTSVIAVLFITAVPALAGTAVLLSLILRNKPDD